MRTAIASLLVIALAFSAGAAVAGPTALPGVAAVLATPNRTVPSRARSVDMIVIHSTEGSFDGSIRWLQNPRAEVSSHFVVSRLGRIVQLVPLHHVAWHAGNRRVNRRSIGIEHEGWAWSRHGFTARQLEASARLTARLVRLYGVPFDRRHIIGHDEVPDPLRVGRFGGSSHHTDPGPRWPWRRYMGLVWRVLHPPRPLITTMTPQEGRTARGRLGWRVRVRGAVERVEFRVDGRRVWIDHRRPFAFGGGRPLRTVGLENGPHLLEARAVGPLGSSARRATISVWNPDYRISVLGLRHWGVARGRLAIRVRGLGAETRIVRVRVDGFGVGRDLRPPFRVKWDTRTRRNGTHVVHVEAVAVDGRVASRRAVVVVRNRR